MGYRSDIQMVIIGPEPIIVGKWAEFILTNPWTGEGKDPLSNTDDLTITRDDVCATICLYGSGWKWYDSYPDVQRFEAIWELYKELYDETEGVEPGRLCGAFVRIGENDDDTETRYFGDEGYELIQVSRAIHSEYSLQPQHDIRS
jgi:hypothetical protein